jgi:hypothetical protein
MYFFTADEEIMYYKQLVDDAIKKLQEKLVKHGRPKELFWSYFDDEMHVVLTNDENSDDHDHESSDNKSDIETTKTMIHDILQEDGQSADESEIENFVDLYCDTTHRINGKKKFKHSRTPPNTPVDTSHSSNPSLPAIHTPPPSTNSQLLNLPTTTPLLPLPLPSAPPLQTVSQIITKLQTKPAVTYNKINFGPFDFFTDIDNDDQDNNYT